MPRLGRYEIQKPLPIGVRAFLYNIVGFFTLGGLYAWRMGNAKEREVQAWQRNVRESRRQERQDRMGGMEGERGISDEELREEVERMRERARRVEMVEESGK